MDIVTVLLQRCVYQRADERLTLMNSTPDLFTVPQQSSPILPAVTAKLKSYCDDHQILDVYTIETSCISTPLFGNDYILMRVLTIKLY